MENNICALVLRTMAGFLSEEEMLTAEFRDHEKHEALDPYQLTLDPSGPMPPPKRSTVPEPEEPEAPRLPVPTQTPLLHRGTDGEQRNRRLLEETMRSDERSASQQRRAKQYCMRNI